MGRCGAGLREGAVGRAWTAVNEDFGAPWGHFSASPLWSPPEISQALLDPVLTAVNGRALAGMMTPILCGGKPAGPQLSYLLNGSGQSLQIYFLLTLFIYLTALGLSCGTWDL